MYAVSDQYKRAVKSTEKKGYAVGVLNVNGTEYPLNDSNITKGSLYVTNQIVNDNKLCFGAVYAGECGVIINSDIDRYSLYGAKINLNYSLEIDENGLLESVPLGEFFVDDAQRIGSTIKITAVDAMSNFDKPIDEDINGYLYDLVVYICDKCGVELSQTQAEIEELHSNATGRTYTILKQYIDTYRDALSYLSMVVCSNAIIDRFGKLKFIQYATTACDSNDRDTRINNCKFSDYTVRYSCIKARFLANENHAPYSVNDEDINGLTLDIGDIPIVGGTPDGKYAVLNAMLDTLKQIVYVPSTLYISSNPAYDLGDMIECRNINNSTDAIQTYVMHYNFEYRNKETINCYGENPLLQSIKSDTQKMASSFENQIANKNLLTIKGTNAQELTIGQKAVTIVTLGYVFSNACQPTVLCTIPFSIDRDGYVEFSLYDGVVPIRDIIYSGYYEKGSHFASFLFVDNCRQGERRELNVLARAYADFTSATRVQEANIKTLQKSVETLVKIVAGEIEEYEEKVIPVDTTEPFITIGIGKVEAVAIAMSGSVLVEWDGNLDFVDEFAAIDLPNVGIVGFTGSISFTQEEAQETL